MTLCQVRRQAQLANRQNRVKKAILLKAFGALKSPKVQRVPGARRRSHS